MKEFEHINVTSLSEAISLLSDDWSARIIAGGTDLLTEMKNGIIEPARLVNIKTVPDLDYINYLNGDGLRIGVLATLDKIEKDEIIKRRFSILEQAAGQVAAPQIRNMGTVGGNLCQKPRCWYYRNTNFHCLRKEGRTCFAVTGENRYHAIIGGGPCFRVHPSDMAVALEALDARVKIISSDGGRVLPLEDFFTLPRADVQKDNVLEPDEILSEIQIPDPYPGSGGIYLKAMERKAWDFAMVSVAIQVSFQDSAVRDARIVFGGVAPVPWRAKDAEILLKGNHISEEICEQAGEAAISESRPLKGNGYKVSLAKSLVKRALSMLYL